MVDSSGGGSRAKETKVFVAFRFHDPASCQLREQLGTAAENLGGVRILDGKVEESVPWAKEVRTRIKGSKFMVADVTGPSREVMFEFGLAGNKPVILVVHRSADVEMLPVWITNRHVRSYEGTGTTDVIGHVMQRTHESSKRNPTHDRPKPVPTKVVWLQSRDASWASGAYERFQNLAKEAGLEASLVAPEDLFSFEDLNEHLRAWLVVGCLDGGRHDYAAHFFFGDVVARQRAGSGQGKGQSIVRHAIAFSQSEQMLGDVLADSVRRVSRELVELAANETDLLHQAKKVFERHKRWLTQDLSN